MNFEELSKSYRTTFGFYPTSKDDSSEWSIYCRAVERADAFLHVRGINSGNLRALMSEVYKYAWQESGTLYDYAKYTKGLQKLLPTPEATHCYIMTIVLSLVSNDAKIRHENKKLAISSKKRQRHNDVGDGQ